jgi:hypothetical protein
MVLTLEVVTITIEDLACSFDMSTLPMSLDPRSVLKDHHPKTLLPPINKISFEDGSICITIYAFAVLFASRPLTLIHITVRIVHASTSIFDIVVPLSSIDVAVSIVVGAKSLLTSLHRALKALSISK